jgi:DNA ligase-1
MPNTYKIFEQLRNTNSIKEKEKILLANKNNEKVKTLLELNLNPDKVFQFNKMPYEWEGVSDKFDQDTVYKMFIYMIDKLQKREVTGNDAKLHVQDVFKRMLTYDYDLYSKVLLKGAIGVGSTTVNKVWPKLIPQFKLMLAPNKLPNIMDVVYPTFVQPKLDGYRCIYLEGKLWSRTGKPFSNKNLATYFKSLSKVGDNVLDGELYVKDMTFNALQKVLNTEDGKLPKGLKYYVYDTVPLADWKKKKTKITYGKRLTKVRELLTGSVSDFTKVIDIANDLCETPQEVIDLYKKYLKAGYEGVMLKRIDGLYLWKRATVNSGEMLKLKPFTSADLRIRSIYEGEGNFQGKAGGVVVDFNGVAVSVGSGFDIPTRENMASKPDEYIGKTVEVKYFEETEDGSLRFPVFTRFRPEKD